MKEKTWKSDIDLSTRKKRKKFKMFIKQRYLCVSEDYCKKSYFFCPDRFECKYHYLAKRRAWYNNRVNQARLFARLRRVVGEDTVRDRFIGLLIKENSNEYDITMSMFYGSSYSSCLRKRITK